jgi:hypothetical protein
MTAHLIDHLALSRAMRMQLAERAAALTREERRPGLAVLLVVVAAVGRLDATSHNAPGVIPAGAK